MTAAATAHTPSGVSYDAPLAGRPEPGSRPGRDPWDRAGFVDRLLRSRALAVDWRDRPRLVLGATVVVAVMVTVGWWLGRPSSAGPIDGAIPFASAPALAAGAAPTDGATAPGGSGSGTGPSGASSTATSVAAAAEGPGVTPAARLVVHVAGAVSRPGIVQLEPGARVVDAIEAAGGAADDADLDQLNLAAPLADGVQVRVPHHGETVPAPVSPAPAVGGGGAAAAPPAPAAVDLNRATAAELDQLPGIGPSLAAAIVTWRTDHGPFKRIDDLLDVPGIGPAKLATLADHVTV